MMQAPLPDIIALPYGESPPLHVHARSWRQLLKLMVKLSSTQIQPSISAVAATGGELSLRAVVQYFKVSHSIQKTRIFLRASRFIALRRTGGRSYISPLTIPPDHRYTNGDVNDNVLPYSYRLSSLPTLLSGGPESQVSSITLSRQHRKRHCPRLLYRSRCPAWQCTWHLPSKIRDMRSATRRVGFADLRRWWTNFTATNKVRQ